MINLFIFSLCLNTDKEHKKVIYINDTYVRCILNSLVIYNPPLKELISLLTTKSNITGGINETKIISAHKILARERIFFVFKIIKKDKRAIAKIIGEIKKTYPATQATHFPPWNL